MTLTTDYIRVLTYNILNGCHDHDRRQSLYTFLSQTRADVVGLVEADGWAGQEREIVDKLEYPFVSIPNTDDHYHKHPVLFSHFPIQNVGYIPVDPKTCEYPHHRGALIADLQIQDKVLRTMVCHLKHDSETSRVREIDLLLPLLKGVSNVLAMGDFNTFSPEGDFGPEYEQLLRQFVAENPTGHSYLLPRLREMRDTYGFATIRRLLVNYKDAHSGSCATLPTRLDVTESKRPPEKLDYIFTSVHLVLQNARVHQNGLTDTISDHYPISVDVVVDSLR